MAIFTIHGGHAKHGNKYCGAVGYCSESLVDRQIKDAVIKWLRASGDTVYDCTVDSGWSQGNIIAKIKKEINSHKYATANISIHLNALKKVGSDGKVKGCEVEVYKSGTTASCMGARVCAKMAELGFINRGVKVRTNLGVLKGITNGGANILVECFFCDDLDDYKLFTKVGVDAIGKAIAEGVLGRSISFTYEGIDYSRVFDPGWYAKCNPDVVKELGSDANELFKHFIAFGSKEISRAGKTIEGFNVEVYRAHSQDLQKAFGWDDKDLAKYYKHYCEHGYRETRRVI